MRCPDGILSTKTVARKSYVNLIPVTCCKISHDGLTNVSDWVIDVRSTLRKSIYNEKGLIVKDPLNNMFKKLYDEFFKCLLST